MNTTENEVGRRRVLGISRGASACILTFVLYKITALAVKIMATTGGAGAIFNGLPNWAIYLTIAVSAPLIYNSVIIAFAYYSRDERALFVNGLEESGAREIYFISEMREIFSSAETHVEATASTLPLLLIAAIGGFSEIPRIFFPGGEHDAGFIAPLVLLLPCLISFYLSRYEARRLWLRLWREKNPKKLSTLWGLALRFAIIFILYPVVYPWAPLLIFVLFSLGAIIAELSNALSILGLIAAVAAVIAIALGIRLLSALHRRKKFLKRLRSICSANGARLSEIKNPYISFLDESRDCAFTVEYGEEKFDCILISIVNKGTPFTFTSATGGYFRHRLGTKNHFIGYDTHVSFFHTGDGAPLIIMSPTPKYVYVEDMGSCKRIISWERIFGYTVHDEESFLGGLDRKCLGKSEPKYN